MEKIEILKTFFKNENIEFDKYVYRCFLINELGKSIFCSVKEFDDLYSSMEQNDNSDEERNIQKSFQVINQLIFVYGQDVYDFDEWLFDNPVSEKWLEIIKKYMVLLKHIESDPLQWYKEIRQKFVDNQFK